MLNLYERIDLLCRENKTTVSKMCTKIGISKSTMSELRHGRTQSLSAKTLSKIADYFKVSIDFLTTGKETEKSEPKLTPKDERDIAKTLEKALQQLELQQEALMFDGEPLDDETKELLKISLENTARMAKTLAKKKYTPKKYRKE